MRNRNTLTMVAWPKYGKTTMRVVATTMMRTLPTSPTATFAIDNKVTVAPTMSKRPSVSNPNCVIQLEKLMTREPWTPKLAREIVNVVVPAIGP